MAKLTPKLMAAGREGGTTMVNEFRMRNTIS